MSNTPESKSYDTPTILSILSDIFPEKCDGGYDGDESTCDCRSDNECGSAPVLTEYIIRDDITNTGDNTRDNANDDTIDDVVTDSFTSTIAEVIEHSISDLSDNEYDRQDNMDVCSETDTCDAPQSMEIDEIIHRLDRDGYVVVPNVLTQEEVAEYRAEFFKWYSETSGLDEFHAIVSGNGIFKFHEVAHQRFAWLARTNDKIIDIFKQVWNTDELVTSFDGCCYYPSEFSKNPTCWIHTDQSSLKVGRHCVQSFVSFTENIERTIVLYRGSQHLHQDYFNITNTVAEHDWCVLDPRYLDGLDYRQETLHVAPGSLVMWDSRVFHQNTCGPPSCREERLVQYLCYLPRNNPNNTKGEQTLRRKCYEFRRNTSHWPYPVIPVRKQPRIFNPDTGSELNIDYDDLQTPAIDDLREKIEKLL